MIFPAASVHEEQSINVLENLKEDAKDEMTVAALATAVASDPLALVPRNSMLSRPKDFRPGSKPGSKSPKM